MGTEQMRDMESRDTWRCRAGDGQGGKVGVRGGGTKGSWGVQSGAFWLGGHKSQWVLVETHSFLASTCRTPLACSPRSPLLGLRSPSLS